MSAVRAEIPVVRTSSLLPQERRMRPVLWWAAAGAVFVFLLVYFMARWIPSSDFTPAPKGPTPLPDHMRYGLIFQQAIFVPVLFVLMSYIWVIRPWRKSGRLSFDGMLVIAFMTAYWMDFISNFVRPWVVFNAYLPNWGTWANFIPGYNLPRGEYLAEPVFWEWPMYLIYVMWPIVLANFLMRKAKLRWPNIGRVGLAAVAVIPGVFGSIVMEVPWLLMGVWSFASVIPGLTAFYGHYYQYPLYEAFFIGIWLASYALLRYYRDDKGRSFVEKGIDQVRATPRQKRWLTQLALIGVVNFSYLFLYNVPQAFINTLYGAEWPEDIVKRSYFSNQYCGWDTGYACPGPAVPIPHGNSDHVAPDGTLVREPR